MQQETTSQAKAQPQEAAQPTKIGAGDADTQESKRARSTIAFPYNDLDSAVSVAKAIADNVGSGTCEWSQVAGWLGQTITSGAFRLKTAAAKTYGLVEDRDKGVGLTQLGMDIVDPSKDRAARVQAFLSVPLYNQIYERYKGMLLPTDAALENHMGQLGVAPKQKDTARQVFQRAATQAGFFAQGSERLILPAVGQIRPVDAPKASPEVRTTESQSKNGGGNGGGVSGGGGNGARVTREDAHPLIQGLFDELPAIGDEWSEDDRKHWLATADHVFRMLYKIKKKEVAARV